MCTSPEASPAVLPAWCVQYLNEVASHLAGTTADGDTLKDEIARSLGYVRAGWTAPKAAASKQRATDAALRFDFWRDGDGSATQAYESLQESYELADVRSARKRVKKGRDLLRHVPGFSEAVS